VHEHLTNAAGQAPTVHALWLQINSAVVDDRQRRRDGQGRADELLEESHMEDVVEFGARRQLQSHRNRIDELDDAVRPEIAWLQLPLGRLR